MTETPDDYAKHNARMQRMAVAREKMQARRTLERGLLIVHTGNGKGKSSSAFGMAIRSIGWGMKVAILQYVKGKWETGERNFFDAHPDLAVTQKNLAMVYMKRGDLAAAEEQLGACLATREACFQPGDYRVFLTQIDLAEVLAQRGEWDAAQELLEQALVSARSVQAPYGKRSFALLRAAEVFEAHGDSARVAALVDEARRQPVPPDPR